MRVWRSPDFSALDALAAAFVLACLLAYTCAPALREWAAPHGPDYSPPRSSAGPPPPTTR